MTVRLAVEFSGNFSFVASVPIPIDVVDSSLLTVAETTVSLGSTGVVSVPREGLYMVRATLPSGERLSSTVRVPADTDANRAPMTKVVLSPIDPSPNETTAWAYSVQGIPRPTGATSIWADDAEGAADMPAPAPDFASADPVEADFASEASERVFAPAAPAPAFVPRAAPAATVRLGKLYANAGTKFETGARGVFLLKAADAMHSLADSNDPRVVSRFSLVRPDLTQSPSPTWAPFFQTLHVTMGDRHAKLLVALPPRAAVETVVVRSDRAWDAHLLRPLVQGGDPRMDALLSYLAQGAFDSARKLGATLTDSDVDQMLYGKMQDPAGAVVSVYYQLRAGTVTRTDWVKNLADRFPLIADGAVQYGWCLLREPKPDRAAARAYFLTAAQRGIPIYSRGIRLLYDGLNLFAGGTDSDGQVTAAFEAVRKLAAAADWQAAITSLAVDESSTDACVAELP